MSTSYPWLKPYQARYQANVAQLSFPQSLLIGGIRGLAKNTLADFFAQQLLCAQGGCNSCSSCTWFKQGHHLDFHVIEPEKNLIGVDKIRELSHFVATTPQYGAKKVILLRSADEMNLAAANALLKMLEEPNAYLHWILVSSHFDRLPITIISRVQRLMLTAPPVDEAMAYLQSVSSASTEAIQAVLARAGGAPLEAVKLLEQDIAPEVLGPLFSALSVSQIADKWAKYEAPEVLAVLLHFLLDAKRLQVSPTPLTALMLPHYQSEIARFACTKNPKILGALWDKVTKMRAKVVRERGFNASLLYCDLLVDWGSGQ